VLAGGCANALEATNWCSAIGGGSRNRIETQAAGGTIAGGADNRIQTNANWAAIGGGYSNTVSGTSATIPGGWENLASGMFASIPGGLQNRASAAYTLAAGHRAQADHTGTFVWADSTNADFTSTGPDQFLIRAGGGVGIGTNRPQALLHVNGTVLATSFVGDGSGLTGVASLSADQTYTGTASFRPSVGPPFVVGNQARVDHLNADLLDGLDSTSFWKLGGNSGTTPGVEFLGTTDNRSLELKVNNTRALRLDYASSHPNLIAGAPDNTVTTVGSTMAGGHHNQIQDSAYNSVIAGGAYNLIQGAGARGARFGVIAGGESNVVENLADNSVIAGGSDNHIGSQSDLSVVAGGRGNRIGANATGTTISGGSDNDLQANSEAGVIAGGANNRVGPEAPYAVVSGGWFNLIERRATAAVIGGGRGNSAFGSYSTVVGGQQAKADKYGQQAYASGAFSVAGDAQSSLFVLRGTSTGPQVCELFLDGQGERMKVCENSTWSFEILVTARSVGGSHSGGWRIQGLVKNNAGTTVLIGTPSVVVLTDQFQEPGFPSAVRVLADDGHDASVIQGTGGPLWYNGVSIRWVASVRPAEVGF
jgi:hypothetical protein